MASARKETGKAMEFVDVVVEVVDARIPEASCNPMIHELRRFRQRPCLKILNKVDLADPAATQAWLNHYNRQPGVRAVALSCKNFADAARVPKLCQQLAPHRSDSLKPLRIMIMGIPNVGKSTLMNSLLKRRAAKVGDEPAVTKALQRIPLSPSVTLIDSPGMLWPKIAHPEDGLLLAAVHAVGRNAVIEEEVAEFLAHQLLARYPAALAKRYGIRPAELDGMGVVEAVAAKRGCILRGEIDLEKAALILLTDYRNGTLGRISLETPETRQARAPAPAETAQEDATT